MSFCSAYGCSNRTSRKSAIQKGKPKLSFHTFPKNEPRRQLWVKECRREFWTPSARSVLCSEHFTPECFDRTSHSLIRLKPEALPTIFFPRYLQKTPKPNMDAIKIEPDSDGESSECKEQEEVPQPFTFVAVKEEMQEEEDGDAVKGLLPNEEQDVLVPSVCHAKTGEQYQQLSDKNYLNVKRSRALKLQDELKDRMMELQTERQIIVEHNMDVIKVENYSNSNIEAEYMSSLQGDTTIEVKQEREFEPFTSVAVKQELIEEDNTSIKEELNDELPTEEQNMRLESSCTMWTRFH